MIDRPTLRKPRLFFDTGAHPNHVTFDDGKNQRHNLPWAHYSGCRWDYDEPDLLKLEIGPWEVLVRGHNLGPLFEAIEGHALTRVRAQPELERGREHEPDTFATAITLKKLPPKLTTPI